MSLCLVVVVVLQWFPTWESRPTKGLRVNCEGWQDKYLFSSSFLLFCCLCYTKCSFTFNNVRSERHSHGYDQPMTMGHKWTLVGHRSCITV